MKIAPENVIHLMAVRVVDRTAELSRLSDAYSPTIELSNADEFLHPQASRAGHPRNVRILPGSRNFH